MDYQMTFKRYELKYLLNQKEDVEMGIWKLLYADRKR